MSPGKRVCPLEAGVFLPSGHRPALQRTPGGEHHSGNPESGVSQDAESAVTNSEFAVFTHRVLPRTKRSVAESLATTSHFASPGQNDACQRLQIPAFSSLKSPPPPQKKGTTGFLDPDNHQDPTKEEKCRQRQRKHHNYRGIWFRAVKRAHPNTANVQKVWEIPSISLFAEVRL